MKETFQVACNLGDQCTHIQIGETVKDHEPDWKGSEAKWAKLTRVPQWEDDPDKHSRWCRFYYVDTLRMFPNTNSPNMKIYEVNWLSNLRADNVRMLD